MLRYQELRILSRFGTLRVSKQDKTRNGIKERESHKAEMQNGRKLITGPLITVFTKGTDRCSRRKKHRQCSSANQDRERGRSAREWKRVMQTLATLRSDGESLAEVAHDARNMVTALGIYCDLLEEPGVLATPYMHYGHELRLVAAASRRLVEKLVALDASAGSDRRPSRRFRSTIRGDGRC